MPLDPQVARWRERRIAEQVPPLYTRTLAEARAADLAEIQAGAGTPEPVHEVVEETVPVTGATVPLRVYRPTDAATLPALAYFFGGGWTLGQIETCDGICRTLANAAGCVVIAVGYRLAPEHKFPVAVHDCYEGLRWIAEHAGQLGIDPGRLAVGGDSAGGNLAAAVTLLARQRGGPALAAQLLVYPNTCYGADTASLRDNADDPSMFNRQSVDWYWGHYLASPADGADPLASPLLAGDHSGLPPALVITAEYDPLRDEGEQYAEKLRAAGVPTECTRYGGMMHGFFLMSSMLDGGRRAVEQAVAFLRARLGTRPATGPVAVSLEDFEARARALLPPAVWDYAAGGSGSETAMRANRQALDAVVVYPRVLAGGWADPATSLLGTPASMPVAVAPMAYQRLMHPAGEVAMAEAARGAGVPMVLSTLSSCPVEEVAGTGVAMWFQLYWLAERHRLEQLIERAEDAGSAALVVTLDVPVLGRRLRDVRNEFALPPGVVAANLTDGSGSRAHVAHAGGSALAAHTSALFGSALSWADMEWLRARTSLPLALKGILDPRDARRAVDLGADAIVVSNHGGRQLDAAPASIAALPAVVAEVGQQCQVLLDSGIRGGTDVLRALALGADGVLVGRPLLWALAVDGAAGAARALSLLSTEIRESLILAGCPNVAAVRDLRATQESCR